MLGNGKQAFVVSGLVDQAVRPWAGKRGLPGLPRKRLGVLEGGAAWVAGGKGAVQRGAQCFVKEPGRVHLVLSPG